MNKACLSKCTPASNPRQAHADTLVLAQTQLHVLTVHTARGPLAADAPLAGLAKVRVTLPICKHTPQTHINFCYYLLYSKDLITVI